MSALATTGPSSPSALFPRSISSTPESNAAPSARAPAAPTALHASSRTTHASRAASRRARPRRLANRNQSVSPTRAPIPPPRGSQPERRNARLYLASSKSDAGAMPRDSFAISRSPPRTRAARSPPPPRPRRTCVSDPVRACALKEEETDADDDRTRAPPTLAPANVRRCRRALRADDVLGQVESSQSRTPSRDNAVASARAFAPRGSRRGPTPRAHGAVVETAPTPRTPQPPRPDTTSPSSTRAAPPRAPAPALPRSFPEIEEPQGGNPPLARRQNPAPRRRRVPTEARATSRRAYVDVEVGNDAPKGTVASPSRPTSFSPRTDPAVASELEGPRLRRVDARAI